MRADQGRAASRSGSEKHVQNFGRRVIITTVYRETLQDASVLSHVFKYLLHKALMFQGPEGCIITSSGPLLLYLSRAAAFAPHSPTFGTRRQAAQSVSIDS
jgi:hypothetical protein